MSERQSRLPVAIDWKLVHAASVAINRSVNVSLARFRPARNWNRIAEDDNLRMPCTLAEEGRRERG